MTTLHLVKAKSAGFQTTTFAAGCQNCSFCETEPLCGTFCIGSAAKSIESNPFCLAKQIFEENIKMMETHNIPACCPMTSWNDLLKYETSPVCRGAYSHHSCLSLKRPGWEGRATWACGIWHSAKKKELNWINNIENTKHSSTHLLIAEKNYPWLESHGKPYSNKPLEDTEGIEPADLEMLNLVQLFRRMCQSISHDDPMSLL